MFVLLNFVRLWTRTETVEFRICVLRNSIVIVTSRYFNLFIIMNNLVKNKRNKNSLNEISYVELLYILTDCGIADDWKVSTAKPTHLHAIRRFYETINILWLRVVNVMYHSLERRYQQYGPICFIATAIPFQSDETDSGFSWKPSVAFIGITSLSSDKM